MNGDFSRVGLTWRCAHSAVATARRVSPPSSVHLILFKIGESDQEEKYAKSPR